MTLMKTVISLIWHDQGSETVSQRLRDVDDTFSKMLVVLELTDLVIFCLEYLNMLLCLV